MQPPCVIIFLMWKQEAANGLVLFNCHAQKYAIYLCTFILLLQDIKWKLYIIINAQCALQGNTHPLVRLIDYLIIFQCNWFSISSHATRIRNVRIVKVFHGNCIQKMFCLVSAWICPFRNLHFCPGHTSCTLKPSLLTPLAQWHRPNNGMKNNISLHLSLQLFVSLFFCACTIDSKLLFPPYLTENRLCVGCWNLYGQLQNVIYQTGQNINTNIGTTINDSGTFPFSPP